MILLKLATIALLALAITADDFEDMLMEDEIEGVTEMPPEFGTEVPFETNTLMPEEEIDDDEEEVESTTGGYSTILGEKCSFQNGANRTLYQVDEKNTNSIIEGILSIEKGFEARGSWKIIRWHFDEGLFYEIKNDDSEEYIAVENLGTEEVDSFGIIASPFQFLHKSPSNLWDFEDAPNDNHHIKHKDSGLYLNLDSEQKAILESSPEDSWMIRCE